VEDEGTIVTTHFNVSGKIGAITVRLWDGRELEGKLLGYNGTFDLAAIKVEASGLPVARKARVEDLKTGQAVLAIGRAPDGSGLTINPGIVSAPSRLAGRGLQTDAKLNYGNVGGPLVDTQGRLVGVTCKVDTKYSSSRGQNSGVGFAITHDRLGEALADLKAGRNVEEPRRPFLGVQAKQDSEEEGVELELVQAGSAAEKAGLLKGDVILELEGKKIANFEELRAAIGRKSPGDRILVKVRRGEEEKEFQCDLGWAPGE
jgi:serine protease Do